MNIHRRILIPVFFLFAVTFLLSFIPFDSFVKELVSKMLYLEKRFPVEKTYLHLDKQIYTVGEKIWFKSYVVRDAFEKPSDLSQVLYVDLLSPENVLIEKQKIRLQEGMGEGSFYLSSKHGSGNYKVVAYTNWNRNFGQEYYFSQKIPVYDFRKEIDKGYDFSWVSQSDSTDLYDLQFTINFEELFKYTPVDRKVKAAILHAGKELPIQSKVSGDTIRNIIFEDVSKKVFNSQNAYVLLETFDEDWKPLEKRFPITTPYTYTSLKFFPEGGDLAEGLRTRVAFELSSNEFSDYNQVKGELYNSKSKLLAEFSTSHNGRGSFYITPLSGENYHVVIKKDDFTFRNDLPEVTKNPLALSVVEKGNDLLVIVKCNDRNMSEEGVITLIGQSGNRVFYAAQGDYPPGKFSAVIPKKKFPEGIVQFTLFDTNQLPVAERLTFVEYSSSPAVDITTNKSNYAERERVEMEIQAFNASGKPLSGDFSLSVTDLGQVPFNSDNQNLKSSLLLTSDLKGEIKDPGYYFNSANPQRKEHLDLLLLTHGWRRYHWQEVLKDSFPDIKFLFENGLTIHGSMKYEKRDKSVPLGNVKLWRMGEEVEEVYKTVASDRGNFILQDIDIEGEEEIALIGTDAKGEPHVIFNWDSLFHIEDYGPRVYSGSLRTGNFIDQFINKSQMRHQVNMAYSYELSDLFLDEITIKGEEITFQEQQEEEFMKIYQNADVTVDIANMQGIESAVSVIDLLIGKVAGLKISGSYSNPTIIIRGVGMRQYESVFETVDNAMTDTEEITSINFYEPLFIVDGTAVKKEVAMGIPVTEIDHVDVLKGQSTAMYGSRGANGIIAIYTKRGAKKLEGKDGVKLIDFKGYSVSKEFYSPDYSEEKEEHIKPDVRATVHWEPMIKTDGRGKAKIVFYTTDQLTRFNVDLQGLGENGEKIVATSKISVSGSQ